MFRKCSFEATFRRNGHNVTSFRVVAVDIISAMHSVCSFYGHSFVAEYMTSLKFVGFID